MARLANLEVWQIDPADSQAMAKLAERSMQLQVTVQEGHIYVGNGRDSVALEPRLLKAISTRR